MIQITDVVKAINGRLKQAYPNVPIQASDVKEGFQRPCFYTEVADYTTEQLMTAFDRKMAVISILYFPTDPHIYQVELLDVRERLQGAFIGSLNLNDDFMIHILDVSDTISDGVLNLDIEIEYYVRRQEQDTSLPFIEEMEITNI